VLRSLLHMFHHTEKVPSSGKPALNESLLRALSVLRLFSPTSPELTLTEVSQMAGLPIATASRILATLTHAGFLDKDEHLRKYRIGPETYMAGSLYLRTNELLQVAGPVIRLVNELTEDVVGLSVLQKGYQVLLMREESRHTFRFAQTLGVGFPAHAVAVGKALLSAMSEAEIDELYPGESLPSITPNTLTSKAALRAELQVIRETGVAFNNEESRLGITAVAAVVKCRHGRAIAAISIASPTFRLDSSRQRRHVGMVKLAADLVSYRLGYRGDKIQALSLDDLRQCWVGQWKEDKVES